MQYSRYLVVGTTSAVVLDVTAVTLSQVLVIINTIINDDSSSAS